MIYQQFYWHQNPLAMEGFRPLMRKGLVINAPAINAIAMQCLHQ